MSTLTEGCVGRPVSVSEVPPVTSRSISRLYGHPTRTRSNPRGLRSRLLSFRTWDPMNRKEGLSGDPSYPCILDVPIQCKRLLLTSVQDHGFSSLLNYVGLIEATRPP